MDLYVPTKVAASPAIVVALHYCSGTAQNAHGWFKSYADMYGFTIITPTAGGNCFDATPTRSGERANIVSMVQYVIMQKNADPKRVFSVGASSGACMTQALLAAYPDIFAAGSSLAGVPAGAWQPGNNYGWNDESGQSAKQLGDAVRNADPGFNGTRPRIQLWQGQGDTTLTFAQNYPAEVSQWTNVFGVSSGDETMVKPPGAQDTWDRTSYKDPSGAVVVEANKGPSNVPHDLTGRGLWADVVRFFGLDQTSSGNGGASSTGGAPSAGAPSMAGRPGMGGRPGTGGMSSSGGAVSTGGRTSSSGGANATGGTSPGGRAGGGAPSGTGGTSMSTGGQPSASGGTGGTTSATGGTTSTTGGTTSTTGGTSSGSTATGGGPVSSGGTKTGGSAGSSSEPPDSGGCNVSARSTPGHFAALLALGLGLFARRRRARR